MATYEFRSWETINLPLVRNNTYYKILDHQSDKPGPDTQGVVYEGVVLQNYRIEALNEVLSQYVLPADIAFTSGVSVDDKSHATFYIYYTIDDWETFTFDIVIITYDWSYTKTPGMILSRPITTALSPNQYFVYTVTPATPDVVTNVELAIDGQVIMSRQISGYNRYTFVVYLPDALDKLPERVGERVLTIGPARFTIGTNDCGFSYMLYYLNELGGWDFLPFRGSSLHSADISRLQYERRTTAGSTDFSTVDYMTTIKDRWSLNTQYLDDIGSQKMINLLASNRVYLQDLASDLIMPVNITSQSCEYKTFANNGRRLVAYTVEAAASSKKYRV